MQTTIQFNHIKRAFASDLITEHQKKIVNRKQNKQINYTNASPQCRVFIAIGISTKKIHYITWCSLRSESQWDGIIRVEKKQIEKRCQKNRDAR